MRDRLIMITGGARSGKSSKALALAASYSAKLFVATAVATDEEMRARIDRHRTERGDGWITLEEPIDLAAAMGLHPDSVVVVDCMTVWLANALEASVDIDVALGVFLTAASRRRPPVIVVTNEVGQGIVPSFESGRRFRDLAGIVNQRLASAADEVWLMVSGVGLLLKG